MKAADETEEDYDYKKEQMLKDKKDNLSLQNVSESLLKNAAAHEQSKELYFTLNIYKDHNLRIYKPLFLIKLALFFWFAGAIVIQAFFTVFLKQRGLTVAQVSLAIGASVVVQLLATSLSAIIADKIGRTKPVLFAHLFLTSAVCVAFVLIPPLKTADDIPQFELFGSVNQSIHKLTFESWCNKSASTTESTCKLYYATNISRIFNEAHCFTVSYIKEKITTIDRYTNEFENLTVCHYESVQEVGSDYLPTLCKGDYCELLVQECMSETGKCFYWDFRTTLLFSFYVLLITIHFFSHSCVFRFYDVTVMSLTAEHNGDFGKQRVFANIGSLVGPSLAGYVMQATTYGYDRNYSLAFVFYCVFTLLSALACWKLKVPQRKPGKSMWRKVIAFLKNPDYLAFIVVLLVLGTSFNFMVVYSNWFLEDLGASQLLLGLVMPLSSAFSIVSLFASKWFLQMFGAHKIFIIALVGYGYYNVAFSFLVEPWYSILIGIVPYTLSYNLNWVAVVEFSHDLAPEGLYASVIVMAGLIHYVFCRMTASLIGGMLMDAYGGRVAFRVMGGINLTTAILYGCFCYCRRSFKK
ncbi:hypothetical protein JTE90_023419 [Oedothorax gibbosus]|uniref:Major facilitator superfamily associated domain-containing protein n=1 Tax=Oedothorax gibbosus TaxID=931172 RepID=A0AAV6TQK2_9ARAC|nr:hypothetical protein JTE90_023419 [Oedothorax gibbosus]